MNPSKMFINGKRMRDHNAKDLPSFSARLMPEFDKRRNIRDMFQRHASVCSQALPSQSPNVLGDSQPVALNSENSSTRILALHCSSKDQKPTPGPSSVKRTISASPVTAPARKRSKVASSTASSSNVQKGQRTLQGFFQKKSQSSALGTTDDIRNQRENTPPQGVQLASSQISPTATMPSHSRTPSVSSPTALKPGIAASPTGAEDYMPSPGAKDKPRSTSPAGSDVHDPIVAKEGWTKLFTKKQPPRCEDHDEPCTLFQTKKKGINSGRSFWICARYVIAPCFLISLSLPAFVTIHLFLSHVCVCVESSN
jgi:AP endonuclease-2